MKFKPDWAEARERLTALWEGRATDRPCMAVIVSRQQQTFDKPADKYDKKQWGTKPPPSHEAQWLDPDWVVGNALSKIQDSWWGGEAIPSYLLMAGWLCSLGGRPHFDQRTIWFEQFEVDFDKPHPFHHRPTDPWVQRFDRLLDAMVAAAGKDDFLIGAPAILPAHDVLSMHMGTQNFLLALIDHPDWMLQAITDGTRELLQARREITQRVRARHDFWYGNAGWMPFWAPVPYCGAQSDVSCMLSPEHFEQFVIPELDLVGRQHGAVWYHLDGSDAKQHLPRLLSLPYIKVIQYVPRPSEPLNGIEHLAMYRQIQAAGRIVHIEVPKNQVEPLCRALDPSRLMLDVSYACESVEEGEELLAAAKRWTSARSKLRSSAP